MLQRRYPTRRHVSLAECVKVILSALLNALDTHKSTQPRATFDLGAQERDTRAVIETKKKSFKSTKRSVNKSRKNARIAETLSKSSANSFVCVCFMMKFFFHVLCRVYCEIVLCSTRTSSVWFFVSTSLTKKYKLESLTTLEIIFCVCYVSEQLNSIYNNFCENLPIKVSARFSHFLLHCEFAEQLHHTPLSTVELSTLLQYVLQRVNLWTLSRGTVWHISVVWDYRS